MNPYSVTAPGFRGWKTWGPVFNTAFLLGVATWYSKMIWGNNPVLDVIVTVLLLGIFVQIWWLAIVIKLVEIDVNHLRISGLRKSVIVPRSDVLEVRDRSHLKRVPSVILLKSPTIFGTSIRFFPSKPVAEVIAELSRHLGHDKKNL